MSTALWSQTERSPLDSLFWIPIPADSIVLEQGCWVERHGPLAADSTTGLLRWSEEVWAWQPDTAQDNWSIRWNSEMSVWSVNLTAKDGRLERMLVPPAGGVWSAAGEEGKHEGLRFRMLESGGYRLKVIRAGELATPTPSMVSAWHRTVDSGWRPLEPMPGQIVPVGFTDPHGAGWQLNGCRSERHVVNLVGVWAFDPNRSLMDVVRERKAAAEGGHR